MLTDVVLDERRQCASVGAMEVLTMVQEPHGVPSGLGKGRWGG
jgi:hypothetical protein